MLYSVITINYNNREGLRRTMASVVGQTSSAFEYIVIDGGSTDGSLEVVREHAGRLAYWVSEPDRGIYHAMNKGVAQACGDYCIFMNSGDCFFDATVLERVQRLQATEDIVVGKVVSSPGENVMSPPPSRPLSLYHLYSGAIPHQGAFIRTALLRQHPYDESLRISADWKFFLQTLVLDNRSLRYTDEPVARYDLSGVSSENPEAMRQEKEQVLAALFPPRLLDDYRHMKQSECLTQTLTPQLRANYGIDRLLFKLGTLLLKLRNKKQ